MEGFTMHNVCMKQANDQIMTRSSSVALIIIALLVKQLAMVTRQLCPHMNPEGLSKDLAQISRASEGFCQEG